MLSVNFKYIFEKLLVPVVLKCTLSVQLLYGDLILAGSLGGLASGSLVVFTWVWEAT